LSIVKLAQLVQRRYSVVFFVYSRVSKMRPTCDPRRAARDAFWEFSNI